MLLRRHLWYLLIVWSLLLIGTQSRCPEGTHCTKVDDCLNRGRETLIQRCRNGICCLLPKAGDATTQRSETVTAKPTTSTPPTITVPNFSASPAQSFRPIQPAPPFGPFLGLPNHPFGGVIPWHIFNPGHVTPHRPFYPTKRKSQRRQTTEDKKSQARIQDDDDSSNNTAELTALTDQPVQAKSRQKRNIPPVALMHHGPIFPPMPFAGFAPGFYGLPVPWIPPMHSHSLPHFVPPVPPIPIMPHAPVVPPLPIPQVPPITGTRHMPPLPPAPLPPPPMQPPYRIIIREGRPLHINMIQYKGIDFRHLDRMCQARSADDPICRNF